MIPDLSELSPQDLFYTQREAYLKGDIHAVMEMSKIASSRLSRPAQEDWTSACSEVDGMKFPDDIRFIETHSGESHEEKKNTHIMIGYKNLVPMYVKGFELVARYNVCPKCDNEVRNKQLYLINKEKAIVHDKWFTHQSKDVRGKDFYKIAQEYFAD